MTQEDPKDRIYLYFIFLKAARGINAVTNYIIL